MPKVTVLIKGLTLFAVFVAKTTQTNKNQNELFLDF